ncbi:hypothetical protein PAMP_003649 [Pampus punctatissimus]
MSLLQQQQWQQKGEGERVALTIQEEAKKAAVILWREQEIEVEEQIYDKMRDGDINSFRRQELPVL